MVERYEIGCTQSVCVKVVKGEIQLINAWYTSTYHGNIMQVIRLPSQTYEL